MFGAKKMFHNCKEMTDTLESECRLRHDRPTVVMFPGSRPTVGMSFEEFSATHPDVPERFLRRRYDEISPSSDSDTYRRALKLAKSDFLVRQKVTRLYDARIRGVVPCTHTLVPSLQMERRQGQDENPEFPALD